MAEALKHMYDVTFIKKLSKNIRQQYAPFNTSAFIKQVFDSAWDERELKARMRHITHTLRAFLPDDYAMALEVLKKSSHKRGGFEYMIFPDFVEVYGLDDYQESIAALEFFTTYTSSEFAVRPFIEKYPKKMMAQMKRWSRSDNHHVRRLASEGCRPRLPWAMALPAFKKDPTAVLPILEKLKNDESEYVRRSVANNLNDIAKDNPQQVIAIAQAWLGKTARTDWVVKHACRTLLKQGQPDIMKLFGLRPPKDISVLDLLVQQEVAIGERLHFSFTLRSSKPQLGLLRIEFAMDFMKKNGSLARKIFKISESEVLSNQKSVEKNFSFQKISARVYYPGEHGLAIIVNGHELKSDSFTLL